MSSATRRRFIALGFSTTHDALDAEALLEDMGIEVVPIPAPPEISATCGIALRLAPLDVDQALVYLERVGLDVASRVEIEDV